MWQSILSKTRTQENEKLTDIFVKKMNDGTIEVYDENFVFMKRFKNSKEYRTWIVGEGSHYRRRRF